jgi:translocation and assembly module TamB
MQLENRGEYPLRLTAPTALKVAPEQIDVGSARIELVGGQVTIGELRYAPGELTGSGELTGLALAKMLEWSKVSTPVKTTMLIGGQWKISARQHVDGHIELHRESGDASIVVDDEQLALQITQLAARVDVVSDAVSAELRLEAKGLGRVTGRVETRLTQRDGRWGVSGRSPLSLAAQADVVTIKPLAALFSKSIVADGRVTLEVNGNGTVSQPNLRGRANARQLALEQVENGVLLHDGEAHATFDEHELDIAQLSIGAGNGRFNGKGRIASSEGQLTAHLDWTAEHAAAIQRPDLTLTLSGDGALDYGQPHISLKGRLHVDRGRVELHSGNAPELGDDVVVAGRKSDNAGKAKLLKAAVDLSLDLGPDFLVTGNGLDARLEGKLHVTSPGEAPLTARGEISLGRGTYQAYGRKLEIEKGTLYFTRPLDNPGLNIRAMRKNQQVEAGVEITGTARAPVVKLVSNPEVPDNEKLAWLVLGHKPDAANHTDTQALQQSAALLLANVGTSPLQKQIGLDELSFSSGDTGSTGGVVTLGKRISERIYVMVERGLTTASNAVKVNYQLSRRWSLRTESGPTDAVDIFYSFSWD